VTAVNQTGTATNASSAAVVSNLLDFTAPAAPSALVAAAGATGTVSLSWTDNATNETGFSVQRASNATFTTGLTTMAVAGATAGTGAAASYLSTGLTKGKAYYFRVAATNLVGASAYSATATITAP
jgi:predicted phage tail protein